MEMFCMAARITNDREREKEREREPAAKLQLVSSGRSGDDDGNFTWPLGSRMVLGSRLVLRGFHERPPYMLMFQTVCCCGRNYYNSMGSTPLQQELESRLTRQMPTAKDNLKSSLL